MANPRKPTALKLLEGTDRKDRANPAEPKYEAVDRMEPPGNLRDPRAIEVWNELVGLLTGQRVLTVADGFALAELCNQQSEADQTRQAGGKPGPGEKTQLRLRQMRGGGCHRRPISGNSTLGTRSSPVPSSKTGAES